MRLTNKYVALSLILSAAIFTGCVMLPPQLHLEFLYSLIVLISIFIPGNRTTLDISVGLTLLLILGHFVGEKSFTSNERILSSTLPIFFVWGFTFAVIKYKESQEKLLRSTEHLNAMFQYATEGIIISNEKGEIIMANPTAYHQFGYSEGELIGNKIDLLVPARFSGKHASNRRSYYNSPHSRPMGKGMSLFARRKDESEFPVEVSLSSFKINSSVFVISFIIDITDRRKQEDLIRKANEELEQRVELRTRELAGANQSLAEVNRNLKEEMEERARMEDALRDSQRLYSTISHNFPDGIICVLDTKLEIVFADGREINELGLTSDSLTGKRWSAIGLFKDTPSFEESLKKVFNWESASIECTISDRFYSLNAVPLPDARGIVKEILLVIRNITRRKRAEQEILLALDKERTLNEMKSKFVSIASHEFRTPLSTILSSVSLIDRYHSEEDREKRARHIDRIKSSVKNLTEILNDFLSLEKLEAGKVDLHVAIIDLPQFCEEITEELQALAKPGQVIQYRHEGDSRNVQLDKQLLRNVFINLLNNAIKYSPENSTIEFSTHTDGEIRMQFRDQGMGIPEEDQEHLFERFFRAGNVTAIQGTGLGLNIVRKYVELMGGTIGFTSQVNKGTIFTLTFPKEIKSVNT